MTSANVIVETKIERSPRAAASKTGANRAASFGWSSRK
jgi:hypothetical protein